MISSVAVIFQVFPTMKSQLRLITSVLETTNFILTGQLPLPSPCRGLFIC